MAGQARRTLREIGYHVSHPRQKEMAPAVGDVVVERLRRDVLDQAHAEVEGYVAAYEPASQPPEVLRVLERLLARAKVELL